ncbi:MAG TPA: hypothetical protein VI356_16335 [Myxococcales bacterium]
MKARRIVRGEGIAPGLVLVRGVGGLPKGRVLSDADVRALEALPWSELQALELERGDVHEEVAGRRLASAAAGAGVEAAAMEGGSFPLLARRRGIVDVDADRLARINTIPDLALYTLPRHFVATEGEAVGRAKVVPFVTREERVQKAEEIAAGGLVSVRPFLPLRGALLVHEQIAEAALQRARGAFEQKLAFFGAQLAVARAIPGNPEALATAIREEQRGGAGIVVLAGSRSMDPDDPVLRALEVAGARMERHGVPAYPGTLLWIAYLGDIPVVGAPSCGIFSRATSLDVVLPRLMAGDRMDAKAIAELSAGGLLAPASSYFLAPYKSGVPRGQLE